MFQVFDVPRGRPGMEFAFRWLCLPVLLATLCVSPSGGWLRYYQPIHLGLLTYE
jgi:hypothetical protein